MTVLFVSGFYENNGQFLCFELAKQKKILDLLC